MSGTSQDTVQVDSPTELRNPDTTDIDQLSTVDILREITAADSLFGTKEYAWVHIALQRDPRSHQLAHRRQIHAPVDAQYVCSRFSRSGQQVAGRLRVEDHRRIASANLFDQKLCGGQREFAVLLERQFSNPGVE